MYNNSYRFKLDCRGRKGRLIVSKRGGKEMRYESPDFERE